MDASIRSNITASMSQPELLGQSNLTVNADDASALSGITSGDNAPAPVTASAANDASMREVGDANMSWGKAGGIVGKHSSYAVAGSVPFAAAAGLNMASKFYQFGSELMSSYGQEGYSWGSSLLEAAGSSLKVGAYMGAAALVLAYPLGRFVMAPTAEKSYEKLMPNEMKEVVNFAAEEIPAALKKGYDATANFAGQTYDAVKNAPETAPAALVKAGVALGGLTQQGANAVSKVTQEDMTGDARYDRAAENHTKTEVVAS